MRGHGWLVLGVSLVLALVTTSSGAQFVYNGGKCSGSLTLQGGNVANFIPGTHPAPQTFWVLVTSGQGNAILTDGAGGQTDGLYLNTGDVLLFQPAPLYQLYFQGGLVQICFGGIVLNRPPVPVCSTGALGPVFFQTNRIMNLMTQTEAGTTPTASAYAYTTNTTKTSGNITYTLVTGLVPLGSFDIPACSGSSCCQPQTTTWALKNLTGGTFTIYAVNSGGANFDWNTAVPAPFSCTASVSPTSGTAPVAVTFSATAVGGSFGYAWRWAFGDGSTSNKQQVTHTYTSGGKFTWKLVVTDLAGTTCVKAGTIQVASPLVVTATANPRQGSAPLTSTFSLKAKGGTPPYGYTWDFGDGSTSHVTPVLHTFTDVGAYPVQVTVSDSKGKSTIASAPVYVGVPIPPAITGVTALASPFRLNVKGADFQSGCAVTINGATVPQVVYSSSTKVLAKGGADLKAMVPKGQVVCVVVQNPDGGISDCYTYTR